MNPINECSLGEIAEFDHFLHSHPDIAELDVFIVDVNGHALGKRLKIGEGRRLYREGLAFSACAPFLDCRGRGQNPVGIGNSDGDPDGVVLPLAGTLHRVAWARNPTAQVMCVMREMATRSPLWFDPREVLRGVWSQCRTAGLYPVMACELEFYLVDAARSAQGQLQFASLPRTGAAPSKPMNLSLEGVEDSGEFLEQVNQAAAAQNLPISGIVSEYGLAQYEINLKHVADPVLAADQAVLLRRLVRGVARARGMDATFMAKPFLRQPGSGLHVHVSIVDEQGSNRFAPPRGELLLRQAIAGMQVLMFDSIALFAPNFNSYRRYAGSSVATNASWGYNNRSVAFRIPAGSGADTRIEHRLAAADASPHLTVAGILAAILHGTSSSLEPGTPTEGRAPAKADPSFPQGLLAGLDRLEQSSILPSYIPRQYLQAYAQHKRGEYEALFEEILPQELNFYA
jgi:glutamine synthetase